MKRVVQLVETRRVKPASPAGGFSLIEVVLAMSITVFAVLSILGLLGNALQTNRESEQRIQAANLATTLVAQYRDALNSQAGASKYWPQNFPIDESTTIQEVSPGTDPGDYGPATIAISAQGTKVGGLTDSKAAYALNYLVWKTKSVATNPPYSVVTCALKFQWPPQAVNGAGKKAADHYEVTTSFLVKNTP